MPKAYLIVEHIISEPAVFEEYRVKVGPMIEKYGGRYLTKGNARISSRRAVIGSQSASSSLNSRTSNHSTFGTARPKISRSLHCARMHQRPRHADHA
jgi:hypothetical protein